MTAARSVARSSTGSLGPRRRELLASLLKGEEMRALLVIASSSRDPCLAPFVGASRLGESLLVAPAEGKIQLGYFSPMERDEASASGLDLLSPERLDVGTASQRSASRSDWWVHVIRRALELAAGARGRVALAGRGPSGAIHQACRQLEQEGWIFADGEALILELRKIKEANELDEIGRAARGTVAAFRHLAALLAGSSAKEGELWLEGERLRVGRLRSEVAEIFGRQRLEQPEGNILAPGEEGSVPHTSGNDERTLRLGESLVVDLFPRGRLFADCTRTFCVGEPPESLRHAHAAVEEVLRWSHGQVRPGVVGWELQRGVCEQLSRQGYPTPISEPGTTRGYVHGIGHGVGFELHEYPSFRERRSGEGVLAVGDVLTLEPGLYDSEAEYGVRLEDLCYLGENGLENLTPLPYALDPREWVG